MWSRALRIIRLTLAPAALTEVRPPVAMTKCVVGNPTNADLTVYTNDDLSEYRILTAGFERPLEALKVHGFRHDEIAFWLYSTPGGTVILEWS